MGIEVNTQALRGSARMLPGADTHDVDQGVGRAFEGAYGRIPR